MSLPVLIIVNPKAGTFKADRLQIAAATFKSAGFGVEIYYTSKTGDAEARTKEAVSQAYAMIVSAGGDGTINEVANGAAFSQTPVGVLPFGTSSVLCNDLGLKGDIRSAVRRLINGTAYDVSLGRIKQIPLKGAAPKRTRYFIEMAGTGFDAASVYKLNKRLKAYAGAGAYILSGIGCIVNHEFDKMTVSIDGGFITCNTVIISNGACYGGNLRMAPKADIRRPALYATIFRYSDRLELLAAVADVFRGRHAVNKSKYVEQVEFGKMTVGDGSFHIHVDGDYLGRTPMEVDIVEKALRLVY
ncbi:MAG: YegS/Rv2252/BmrU family lipid kinase [Nitrospirae bacterium]|nr:YegS/Rv2252/BmrU family lipid kinase [Nitrospirota bacterium]